MTTKHPIESLRDVVLAGEHPTDFEIESALREIRAERAVIRDGEWQHFLSYDSFLYLVKELLKPQTQAISANKLIQIPHLGTVS